VLPLVATLISGMIIGRLVDTFIGSKNYFVYIVGDDSDKSTSDLMNAAGGGEFKSKLGDVTVTTEKMPDYGDPDRASSNAEELQHRSDVLMVVGHGSSTSSKRAVPHYLQAEPPIPVILTTETNPALYSPPTRDEDRVPPVFRLFPTDDNQAEVAANFIAKQGAKSVWVVADTSNPTYSEYLARKFLTDVYDVQPSLKVILWSTSLNLPPYAVDKLGIDWVFFAGNWQNALVLVRQLHAMPGTEKAKVLLSDASVDNLLLKYGGPDVEGVYLLHPLSADLFNKKGYIGVGEEAYSLATTLINNVHDQFDQLATDEAPLGYRVRKWLGLHRVSDARRAVAHYMAIAVHNKNEFLLPNGTITMVQDEHRAVIRKEASFHVWRIDHNNFVQIQ
jgi:branched-chain amino acid transport system substrate-binding protein